MKKIAILLLLTSISGWAQIKGNGNIETQHIAVEQLTDIEIQLYAEVTIDQSQGGQLSITTDENLLGLIDTEIVDGTLKLRQKQWIEPSERIIVHIGAPQIARIQLNTNDSISVINLNCETLSTMAINGTITLSGTLGSLRIGAENGNVDATNAPAKEVFLNIWGPGKAVVNATDYLETNLSDEARIQLVTQPKKVKSKLSKAFSHNGEAPIQTEYIDFKIKNNSQNRNNFYVIGPKPNGGKFSYGFPMMPGKTRKENWTIGTKIYAVNALGMKKLLVTINANDENRVVALFK